MDGSLFFTSTVGTSFAWKGWTNNNFGIKQNRRQSKPNTIGSFIEDETIIINVTEWVAHGTVHLFHPPLSGHHRESLLQCCQKERLLVKPQVLPNVLVQEVQFGIRCCNHIFKFDLSGEQMGFNLLPLLDLVPINVIIKLIQLDWLL